MVIYIAKIDFLIFFSKKEWCDHVILSPEEIKIIEFNRGIAIGLKILIPIGGHISPNSMFGEILEWKNAQKNLINSIISEQMNIIILDFNNLIIFNVWFPWNDDSRFKSRHHIIEFKNKLNTIKIDIIMLILFFDKFLIIIMALERRAKDREIGHGLIEIK